MSDSVKIDLFSRAAVGGDGVNDIRLQSDAVLHVSQQYLEVIHSGGNNKVRVSQQYLEVIYTFGTPPVVPPHKQPPGQVKKQEQYLAHVAHVRLRQATRKVETDAIAFTPAEYLSPGAGRTSMMEGSDIDVRVITRRIIKSSSGHIVRKH